MSRELTIAMAGAAIVAAGISGCTGTKITSAGGPLGANAAVGTAGGTTVTIDGKHQNVSGSTVCATVSGMVNIAIGGPATGIAVSLTDANPPQVKSVGLGDVNGVALAYMPETGPGNASATKNGNSYKITGIATGVDLVNPTRQLNKPFEIDVTCPG